MGDNDVGSDVIETQSFSGPQPIGDRCFNFAVRAIHLFYYLQGLNDGASRVIGRQFLRSATSIGANVEEAHAGQSRADFIHKLVIAQKEARESNYWLRLLDASGTVPQERIAPMIQESKEIMAIISKIIVNSKRKK